MGIGVITHHDLNPRRANMLDVFFLAASLGFFVLGALFVRACDHI
jgi:hypothetical protein